jgi:transcription-repair coupling factor (superfamily II helicase)
LTPTQPTTASEDIFAHASQTPAAISIRQRLESGGVLSCSEISRAAQPFFAAWLRYLFPGRPIVVVTDGVKNQESFHQDIETWLRMQEARRGKPGPARGSEDSDQAALRTPRSYFYPAWEALPHEAKLSHADVISERLETLVALSLPSSSNRASSPLVVTSVVALMQRTFAPGLIEQKKRVLARGDRIDPLDLIEWLEEQGYEPEAQVTQKGEIALRGGILDVYPLTSPWPVRLEFFGDELESLRHFDPITQISREAIDSVTLPPGGEIGILKRMLQAGGEAESLNGSLATLADYLPQDSIVLLCEPEALSEHAKAYADQVPAGDPFFVEWDDLLDQFAGKSMTLVSVSEDELVTSERMVSLAMSGAASTASAGLSFTSLEAFRPLADRLPEPQIAEAQRREFFHQLHRWIRQGCAVHIFCNNTGEQERFAEIWQEYGLTETPSNAAPAAQRSDSDSAPNHARLSTHIGALTRGFLHPDAKIVVVTDAEIFGRYKVQRARRLKSPHAASTRSALDIDFTDLEEGDYVVHIQHGIGRYLGLKVLPSGSGRKRTTAAAESLAIGEECLVIEYAASDSDQLAPKLYVPVTEAHLVSKYVGAGKARPVLNTLGGTRWAKTKAQAEHAIRDLAGELLTIQAARESQPGHASRADTPWQREFESAFLYEETPDQLRSIGETKRDMEAARPMDRLICGDVGYGKTEVAIRAAFKAVMDGRQVAVLVPTTILAQQHFNTFRERMADYPVRVEQLSRFRSRREQQRIVQQLSDGSLDIVIGTHRLVQDDIAFKDLGLVVIDEEQRFGVLHKEKLKMLRTLVDVLTLSATPIPRTLYLALTGARDMSTIETPPQDRLPVETVVTHYDERTIRDAIQRELNREGQIYYLHNRVADIESVALRLKSLVPSARVVTGHGQMDSDDLEEVWAKFINGEADVLVSTTIIESGIDIPNANTIIIDRADRFGLSDLYQLRGRVGRYKHQAYAYLLLPRHAALLSDVRKRISAIRQYSSLGSGFKIAMRDLEIRGAGNLLGAQQSGHITAVGFELYCQLLKQSVSALKGDKVKPRIDVQIRLDFVASHPGEESKQVESQPKGGEKKSGAVISIQVPREVATYSDRPLEGSARPHGAVVVSKAPAYIPFDYIAESRQRIEVYRKLAQATEKRGLDQLKAELRDRFGKLPGAVELLLQIGELKLLAAGKGVGAIETKEDKLMLMRNNEYITLGGKFPRLMKKDAKARLNEIKKLLLAL